MTYWMIVTVAPWDDEAHLNGWTRTSSLEEVRTACEFTDRASAVGALAKEYCKVLKTRSDSFWLRLVKRDLDAGRLWTADQDGIWEFRLHEKAPQAAAESGGK